MPTLATASASGTGRVPNRGTPGHPSNDPADDPADGLVRASAECRPVTDGPADGPAVGSIVLMVRSIPA
ncbi:MULTISPECIES: hypothetical protein [unclassified Cryobacterium]|uniref:hypothetical protein n=1 Tax=unclassified Cryobacterium TaxID=2649013 RepID=UPI00141B5C8A|nr:MULTISPECIES: hypothetical protein [unclassified Cryobacterium]